MKGEVELEIRSDGSIIMPYEDGADELCAGIGGTIENVRRASHVEWERVGERQGWTVRSATYPVLALRKKKDAQVTQDVELSDNIGLELAVFDSRETALYWERQFFWQLIEEK